MHNQQITQVRPQEAQARPYLHKIDSHRLPQDDNHNQDISSEAVSHQEQKQQQSDVSSTPPCDPHFPPTPFPTMPSASLEDSLRKLPVDNHYLFGLDRPSTGSASSESSISMLPRVSSSSKYIYCYQMHNTELHILFCCRSVSGSAHPPSNTTEWNLPRCGAVGCRHDPPKSSKMTIYAT